MCEERLNRWKQRLQNLTEIQLPTDYPRELPPKTVEAIQSLHLTEKTALSVLNLSLSIPSSNLNTTKVEHPSPFIILLSAFTILLHKYTGNEDIAVGSSSGIRNPLVLRFSISPNDSFEEVVLKIQRVEREATDDEVPFELLFPSLFSDTKPLDSNSKSSLRKSSINGLAQNLKSPFRVRFFNQTDTPENPHLQATSSITDLTVFINSHSTSSLRQALLPSIEIRITYNQILFSEKRISHILDQLVAVINNAAQNKQTKISDMSILNDRCLGIIPDPSADLKWSEFRGSITDIFSKNAKNFPKKHCVVESTVSAGDLRIFNYCQIHEASNIVAHYLLKNGIEREDVVMIYAHRNVELVIAIMGILKAGATFSVIDPAYPADRQNIYLSVATPRGLIVLEKSGLLHESVRSYIYEKLQIKCEIPGMKILNDGQLKGGSIDDNNVDIFDSVLELKSQDVGVVIGPDSIGTLSFTSGSTGTPKGVRGRHFSLTHYYPWMSKVFELSENDRFTMLSGIAHDPIQRDIFTTLYLGAELHIPTTEDISIPGKLASWMSKHQITVTHLTPAMGQLLSTNAVTLIPTLRNAFFVGDILTKRDCNRLQHLAHNTRIINMYGTTETQRSVSYFLIPPLSIDSTFLSSQKDVMPAGKGMQNVQLIIVNRHKKDILCGVGEIGEIYVRAGGLCEGYLRLDEATKEKFLYNWFVDSPQEIGKNGEGGEKEEEWRKYWKGKRDRLYKSGDLGRYRPDGNVECVGRADHQVKIRGFRIELEEIDSHLSQHPLVRENVTLVRRDKYEEQTLVSYFVPNEGDGLDEFLSSTDESDSVVENPLQDLTKRRYRRLVKQIRDYLKLRLPIYSIPSVFIPLRKMPLTPNGKVDKNSLPFPDTAQFTTNTSTNNDGKTAQQMTTTEQTVHEIWSQLLPSSLTPSLPLDESFFDLGGHSILATRLIFELRKKCGVEIPLRLVFEKTTISEQAKEIDNILTRDFNIANEEEPQLSLLQKNKNKTQQDSKNNQKKDHEIQNEFDYANELESLTADYLLSKYEPINEENFSRKNFFVTGVTGFLGAFIVSDLLSYQKDVKVIAHVRAKTKTLAFQRVKESLKLHLVWKDEWELEERIEVVCGDLEKERLGISEEEWEQLAKKVDVIVHNGALVHWVYPYSKLRAANVIGTIWAMRLASTHHTKSFNFVSSTSVLDTDHYVNLSDSIIGKGGKGIYENDDLNGSRVGLRNGYGQSKWVAEKLIMEAHSRGLPATIIRPGYVVGHSKTGVTNTDDFLWRLVKGCIQLGLIPTIHNIINMCPVDYVSNCIASVSLSPSTSTSKFIFHITHPSNPSFRFENLFNALPLYGYEVKKIEYIIWRDRLMEFTLKAQDNALYPLLHFVLDDLPASTKSPELDDSNTQEIIASKEEKFQGIDEKLMGIYLGYLVKENSSSEKTDINKKSIQRVLELPDVSAAINDIKALKRSDRS
ncbi:13412_t:CDS:10 [Entrophospora sp. SA101]|nr:13412_t:CDS:10 [Entrophospora sp. SA101]